MEIFQQKPRDLLLLLCALKFSCGFVDTQVSNLCVNSVSFILSLPSISLTE